jgi:hypothetical protein
MAILDTYNNLAGSIGKTGLNALYPNEFEVYLVSLELTDSSDNTIDYFTFPVTPSNISRTYLNNTNIKKTAGGISVLKTDAFIPQDISISGDFGRSFKVLVNASNFVNSFKAFAFSIKNGVNALDDLKTQTPTFIKNTFNEIVKTGYGATKILESIVVKSQGKDGQGKPFRLYFYNPTLSESYLCEVAPNGFVLNQSREKNMIWSYNLNLKLLAPISSLKSKNTKSLSHLLSKTNVQKGVTDFANSLIKKYK